MKKAVMYAAAKSAFFVFLVLLCVAITSFKLLEDNVPEPVTWALLIAGADGLFEGYACQVDVAEGFSLLRDGHIKPEHIITFTYNDVANHPDNPFPGTLKSRIGGPNLYKTLQKDYTGLDVKAKIILAVLKGDSQTVDGRKVIKSTRRDRIFIFFSGHGEELYLVLPNQEFWSKHSIINALWEMHSRGKFKSLVFYVNACHSGCVFEDYHLPEHVYIVGATECKEVTSTTLCYFGTCCPTMFGEIWIMDSRQHNLKARSVGQQYRQIKRFLTRPCEQRQGMCSIVGFGDKTVLKHMLVMYQGQEGKPRNTHHDEL